MSTPAVAPAAEPVAPKTFLQRWIWVLAAAVGVLSLTILKMCQAPTLQRLPVLYVLPEFNLTEASGAPFSTKDLDGKVWIASFIFTSCRVECPPIGRANRQIQDKLGDVPGIALVTFSVDPEFDTPEVLTTWGADFGRDPARWHLVTGDRKAIEQVVIDGFRTHMGERSVTGGLVQIAHTMKLVLVDQERGIRHYFDATDDKALALIVDHAKALAKEGPAR